MTFAFEYTPKSSTHRGRIGKITTPHGVIETPAFIFCATKASVKGLTPAQVEAEETQIILSNTYHLMLQPGGELVERMGGLHKFMGWNGPMLTDSGGYQIFSLGHGSVSQEIKGRRSLIEARDRSLLKIKEEGATFRAYTDGSKQLLTPERSIMVQKQLGADLIVVLDECTPYHVPKEYTRRSMEMSHRWATRSLAEFERITDGSQQLYGIVQGGVYEDLRLEGVDFLNSQQFFGHAIGGSLGAAKDEMYHIVTFTAAKLDPRRPIHLLGIGGLRDILMGVKAGIDTFDCVHPTRLARHGGALVRGGDGSGREHINLRNGRFRGDESPIEEDCPCYTCSNFNKAYLHHLLSAREMLALSLISLHNVRFMNRYCAALRQGLEDGELERVASEWLPFD